MHFFEDCSTLQFLICHEKFTKHIITPTEILNALLPVIRDLHQIVVSSKRVVQLHESVPDSSWRVHSVIKAFVLANSDNYSTKS